MARSPSTVSTAIELLSGSAVRAAPRLIGWRLRCGGHEGIIAETEAYASQRDRACHASRGLTPRTVTLAAEAGTIYAYLCYGMHWMLNLVCGPPGHPAAVLIRGLVVEGHSPRATNGPGKVGRFLAVTGDDNGRRLGADDCRLELLPPASGRRRGGLQRGPRVGIDYAGPYWASRPWRWWLSGFPAVGTGEPAGRRPLPCARADEDPRRR